MKGFSSILLSDEKLLWQGRPRFIPYFFSQVGLTLIVKLLIFAVVGFFFWVFFTSPEPASADQRLRLVKTFAMLLGLAIFLFVLIIIAGRPLYNLLKYPTIQYAITDKRVLSKQGLIGSELWSVELDLITKIDLNLTFWDKLIGNSGSLILTSKRTYDLLHVRNPQEVYNLLTKQSFDQRREIKFPSSERNLSNQT